MDKGEEEYGESDNKGFLSKEEDDNYILQWHQLRWRFPSIVVQEWRFGVPKRRGQRKEAYVVVVGVSTIVSIFL